MKFIINRIYSGNTRRVLNNEQLKYHAQSEE